MAEDKNHTILLREILVAIDSSPHSQAALRAAATLARLMEANIRGLFVHEEHWSRISRLPAIASINELTGKTDTLEEKGLEKQVNLLKKRLRHQLEDISRKNKISHSWESTRGQVADEILEAAKKADLITLGRRGRSFSLKNKLGSTAKAIIQKADKPILLLKEGLDLGNTVTVVFDASEASQKGLSLALSLAKRNYGKLSILVLNKDQESETRRNKELEKLIEKAEIPVSVTMLDKPSRWQLLNAINYQHAGLLVIPKKQSFLQLDSLETNLEYLNCPVLMMN
ncbi:universal stress protein [Aliifodinibius salicampi]|uniref:Universal stress protein n=1 Tax=Fodinibius salicampi TaxID=1920655 RepID=A0ABT3PXU0_9BACT|nr:universal stress protein [Fodinibius salicampi]MCW9712659.1 universal stress protein [Fodinibius salicampi]